MTACCSAGRR